jgi:cytoskeletal protein RodZ
MGTRVHTPGTSKYGPYEFSLGDELRGERATLGKTLLDVQRDLRIKAAYIAAIEDCKPEVFPNPSFIPGYVRSYARHLGLDPDEVFHRFCQESGFVPGTKAPRPASAAGSAAKPAAGGFRPDFPLSRMPARGLPDIPVGAIGSLLVLAVLLAGLGYGGWIVLQNFQRVQFAPVEDLPVAVAEVDPLAMPETPPLEEPALTELNQPVAAAELAELYRQQEIEVPILVPRDGPIAALDPEATGVLARVAADDAAATLTPAAALPEVPAELIGPAVAAAVEALATEAAAAPPPVVIVAERPAWIRVYLENKTVIFERILESGEIYALPDGLQRPLVWAGNSGSVYVRVGEDLRGPLGSGTRAAKDIALDPTALAERYAVVEDVPEVISQSLSAPAVAPQAPVAIQ